MMKQSQIRLSNLLAWRPFPIVRLTVMVTCFASWAGAQDSAPSSHMTYNDSFDADIMINEVRVPADGKATYTYYETLGWSGVMGGYAGIQAAPDGPCFLFSIWDNDVAHTAILESAYALPGTTVEWFGGEGTGMKNTNYEIGWTTNNWYVFVVRSWHVGTRTHVGCWVRKGDNDLWYHMATVNVAVDNGFLGGWTDSFLEDWSSTGENKRTTNIRRGWKRKTDKSWFASTKAYYTVNQSDLELGGRSYNYRTNWDGGTDSDETGPFYYMTSGGTDTAPTTANGSWHSIPRSETSPGFAPISINQLTGDLLTANDLRLRWNHDGTTSPQFAYNIEVFSNAQGTGTALLSVHNTVPQAREHQLDVSSLDTASTNYYAFLSVIDIFGQTSTPVSLAFGADGTPDYVTVTVPDGGESFDASGSADITWESNQSGPFDIYLTQGGLRFLQIASGVSGTSNRWDIPIGLPGGEDYRVEVAASGVRDDSNNGFSITPYDFSHASLHATNLTVYSYDSQQAGDDAIHVLDDDPTTIWHTQWSPAQDPYPHEIVLRTDQPYTLTGLTYLPREGAGNGTIKDYEVYVSTDAVTWGSAVATGAFVASATTQQVFFEGQVGQYVKLVALSEQYDRYFASAAEIRVLYQTPTHTITASAATGGAITPNGAIAVPERAYQTFMITTDADHTISNVVVDGVSIGATNSYTFANVMTDHTIHAIVATNQYTLTYQAGTGGTITGATNQTVTAGESGSPVTAAPDAGYHFVAWSDGSTVNPRTDTSVTGNLSVTASFAANLPPVVTSGAGGVPVSGTSARLYGDLTAGEPADVWICWGAMDGGTASTGNWTHVVSAGTLTEGGSFSNLVTGLSTNTTYFYRCYAENPYGSAWSDTAEMFSGLPAGDGTLWSPADLNPTAWYDAADTNTITASGSAVTQWRDKSGNDKHLSQTVASSQPATGSRTINGLNVLAFSQDHIFTTTGLGTNVYSVCMVTANNVEITSTSSPMLLLSNAGDATSTGDGYGGSTSAFGNEVLSVFDEDTTGFTKRQAVSAATLPSIPVGAHLYAYALNTDWFIGFDGSDNLQDLTSGDYRNPMLFANSFSIGAGARLYPTLVNYFDGSVAEVVLLDRFVDAADRQTLEGYLAHKWGLAGSLPAGHPYKGLAPRSGVVANLAPTTITETSAVFNAALNVSGTNANVTVYYGISDGGTNASAWTFGATLGPWTNVYTNVSHLASGLLSGTTYYYTFMASNATGAVLASPSWTFRTAATAPAVTVTHSVPHTWLSDQNPDWTNNYEAAALADPDGDGFTTWQEYWSGTNPQNSNSFLRIESISHEGGNIVIQWENDAVGAGLPPLGIEASGDLVNGSWSNVGQKMLTNGVNAWSNTSLQQLFYRLAVTNAP